MQNTLLVRAPNAARMHLVRTLVERLDQPPAAGAAPAASTPRTKLRTSSRKWPFHSFQWSPPKPPTW